MNLLKELRLFGLECGRSLGVRLLCNNIQLRISVLTTTLESDIIET